MAFQGDAADLDEQVNQMHDRLRRTGMREIVKLANIHLTPDEPNYKGESWHIEVRLEACTQESCRLTQLGSVEWAFCASNLYYCDEDKIAESYLVLREGGGP